MRLSAEYAVPLYLALNRNELGTTRDSFDPFEANEAVSIHMMKWLLFCCNCIDIPINDRASNKVVSAQALITEYLGDPKFPYITRLATNQSVNPMGILILARMCVDELRSEFQQPAIGGYLIFNSLISCSLHREQTHKYFIDVLYESFERE